MKCNFKIIFLITLLILILFLIFSYYKIRNIENFEDKFDDYEEYNEICTCGHREHNGICIYVHCECNCNIYNEESDEYIIMNCICGHREHNGNCYLAKSPCCKPIKCLNYNICKFMCLEEYEMPEFPFCVNCDCDMGKFTAVRNSNAEHVNQ